MKIHSIRIIDFKGIEDQTFEFNDQFTVLIGENGTGKTSILEALAVAINPYVAISQRKNLRPIRKEDVRVINYGYSKESKIKTGVIVQGEIDGKPIEWTIQKSHFDWGFLHGDDKAIKKVAKKHFDELGEDGGTKTILPVFDYLGAGRLWKEPAKSKKTLPKGSRYEGYYECLDSATSIERFISWFKTMELSLLQGNEDAKWKAQVVKRAVSNCLEGWDTIFYGIEEDEILAIRGPLSKKQMLPFSYLSDGQRNIIGIVADIAYRCVQLNPYLKLKAALESPGVVLIDELDLHLHPKWQQTIVKKLKETFPKIQFISTTHSPFIVQSLTSEELINLEDKYSDSGYLNKGIEWVSREIMDVDGQKSKEYGERKELAKKYLLVLNKIKKNKGKNDDVALVKELKALENEIKNLVEKNAINPAYSAFLELKKNKLIDI